MTHCNAEEMDVRVTRRALLDPDVGIDTVREFAIQQGGRAEVSEWIDPSQKWEHKTTWSIETALELWHTTDYIAGCSYIQAASSNLDSANRLIRTAELSLDTRPRADLLSYVEDANDPIALGLALIQLGITGNVSFDEEIYEIISAEFYSEHEEVRDMAVWASSYSPYPEYRPDLEELIENDPSEKVRQRAEIVLRILDEMESG